MAGMTPTLKRVLIWLVIIGGLLLVEHWVHNSGMSHSPQAVSLVTLSGARKVGWGTMLSRYSFPACLLLVYIPWRIYQIKHRSRNQEGQNLR